MGAVAYLLRAELARGGAPRLAVLVLLVATTTSLTLTLLAGARRTPDAYERMVARFAYEVGAFDPNGVFGGPDVERDVGVVAGLDGVVDPVRGAVLFGDVAPAGRGRVDLFLGIEAYDLDASGRPDSRIVTGRPAAPDRNDEAVVSFTAAEALRVGVGDPLDLRLGSFDEVAGADVFGLGLPDDPRYELTVTIVGIDAQPEAFPPRSEGEEYGRVMLTAAALAALPADVARMDFVLGDLDGVAADEVRAAARDVGIPDDALEFIRPDDVGELDETRDDLRVQATGLVVLAVLAGAALLLVTVQAAARVAVRADADQPLLGALGMSAMQRRWLTTARAAAVTVVGVALGGLAAVALSGLFPRGVARFAEVDPGVRFDPLVHGAGSVGWGVAVTILTVGACVLAVGRATGREPGTRRSVRGADAIAAAGLSPSAVAGVQFALRGRGGRAVPAAGMVAVGVIGVATLAAVLTFAASSTHLLDTPRLYGFNWDVTIGDGFGETDLRADAERTLAGDPRVAAYATGTIDGATVGDRSTALYVLDPVVGSLEPTMVEGRLPYGPGDAVVAAAVADRLGLELGDRFEVRRDPSEVFSGGRAGREQFEAVGIGLFPAIGGIVTNTLGEGVGLTAEGFGNLVGGEFPHDVVFIRAVEGRADELAADLAAEGVVPAAEPTELASYGRLSYLPGLIAGIVALVAGAALAHGVVTGVRDRRRDVALLRAVGFSRRQVGAVARWQALTVLALSTVVGVPLGVVGGRRGWAWFADVQHVLEEIVAPWPPLAVTVAGLAVLFLAVATLAARPAARLPLAAVLRSE